jgi:Arf-GAP/SH3 domain/ANK repeat/PH domain-containing protein
MLTPLKDPEAVANGLPPTFLLRLSNADELQFHFTFVSRQQPLTNGASTNDPVPTVDTQIAGLTYIFASSPKEVDNLVVREFHANPNLHKNSNVELVGDYTTGGSASVQFNWSWKWRPPKPTEDRGGGWRSSCSFVEYDQRAHKLNTLAGFDFWVQNAQKYAPARSPRLDVPYPSRLRVPSTQSIESRVSNVSDSDGESGPSYKDPKEPSSPTFDPIPENGLSLVPTMTASTVGGSGPVKVDVATCKPGEDPATSEDGPLFRATMRSLEQKTGNMRLRMKKVLRTAEAAEAAQHNCNNAVADFTDALREASQSNANAVRPALDHYFEKIAKEILQYERQNSINLHRLIIDPVSKLYNNEIKQADVKKREFDEESKDYYAFTSKYLGQRSESLKEKKQKQSDEKYQVKRRTFELKRFDYSSFMHDLHGGRKDQEVLSQLTKYADAQARSYLTTAKKVEDMVPQLDALIAEVNAAEKDYQLMRTEREEKRRNLEKSTKLVSEDGAVVPTALSHSLSVSAGTRSGPDYSSRASSYGALSTSPPSTSIMVQPQQGGILSTPAGASSAVNTSPSNRFKGFRDLDDSNIGNTNLTQRKEGLLWALSRPGSHVDPKGLNKQAWHKFWIVLDQGRLSEYVNWKDKLDLHMDPIDLRMASVREARNSDRRFCFEVITPQFTRVYQAPSEEDVKAWIGAINNALQSAFENRASPLASPAPPQQTSHRKDIAAVLTGKSSSFSGHRQISNPNRSDAQKSVSRHATTGEKPSIGRTTSVNDAEASVLLQRVRSADEGNRVCADCGTDSKVDWCSINLGILLCIECSGIHRSLGTHISKVRSLTLDTAVFTQDIIELLMLVGNRVSNMIWEAKLDRFLKPSPQSTREQRLHFITAKYIDRTYVSAGHVMQQPDDLLLTSIKRNDIQNVLLALALRGNPNALDRSRSTHAVYLALVAADPAAPGGGSTSINHVSSSSTSTLRGSSTGGPAKTAIVDSPNAPPRKPFAVAELLLQNGADIPSDPAPIPLSQAAKLYLEYKTELKLGRSPAPLMNTPAQQGYQTSSTGARDANGDSLSSLPSRALGSSSGFGSSSSSSFGSSSTPLEKRDSRSLKRGSGGFSKISGSLEAFEGMVRK